MKTIELHSTLSNRFEILRRLGAGGYGEVFEALDHRTDSRVAVKRLWHADPDAILRFKREFRVRQDIEHPNLVHVGELLEVDGEWLLTMELIAGTPWLRYVRRDPRRLAATARQVAEALSALHDADLIHCDVKPTNVLVTREGRAVLLDLGLVSARASALDSASQAMGTAWYMAPEQAVGAPFGPAADLYALGACMYEAIAGRAPFEGEPLNVIFRKLREPVPPPSAVAPFDAPEVEAVCVDLLARDPERRPSARETIERLETFENGGAHVASASMRRPTGRLPFVGREHELESMRDAFEATLVGDFRTVHVEADSGLGKTRLVDRFFDAVERPGLLVLSGRCFDRESVPYNAFDGVFDALAEALSFLGAEYCRDLVPDHAEVLAKVFPVLGRVPGFDGRVDETAIQENVFEAAASLLARLAERHALVVAIDDFQWADDESIAFLERLFLGPLVPPILLVLASRIESRCRARVRGVFSALEARDAQHVRLTLGPLDTQASYTLARTILGPNVDAGVATRIVDEARGEPLFIGELAHAVRCPDGEVVSLSVEASVLARVARLDPESAVLVGLVALSAGPTADSVFAAATGLDHTECRRRLLALRAARLVRTDRLDAVHRAEIFHDRVRAAILGEIALEKRPPLHARLANAMRGSGVRGSEDLAYHLLAAGLEVDAAYELVEAALRAAEGFAFDRAASLYAKAMVLGVPHAEEASCALLVTLGNARANESKPDLAAGAYATAAEMTSGDEAIRLRCRAMRAYADAGLHSEVESIARALFRELGWEWQVGRPLLREIVRTRESDMWTTDPGLGSAVVDARDSLRLEVAAALADSTFARDAPRAALGNALALGYATRASDATEFAERAALEAAVASFGSRSSMQHVRGLLEGAERAALGASSPSTDSLVAIAAAMVLAREGRLDAAAHRLCDVEDVLHASSRIPIDIACAVGAVAIYVRLANSDFAGAEALRVGLEERAIRRGSVHAVRTIEAASRILGSLTSLTSLTSSRALAPEGREVLDPMDVFVACSEVFASLHAGHVDATALDALTSSLTVARAHTSVLLETLVRRTRGYAAVRSAAIDASPGHALAVAEEDAAWLVRERAYGSEIYGEAIRAAVLVGSGDVDAGIDRWLRVLGSAKRRGHRTFADAVEVHVGRLIGGPNGDALVARGTRSLRESGASDPDRLVGDFCPGR